MKILIKNSNILINIFSNPWLQGFKSLFQRIRPKTSDLGGYPLFGGFQSLGSGIPILDSRDSNL